MFPELQEVLALKEELKSHARVETIAEVGDFPITAFAFGSESPEAPVLGITAGVHGIEKIGTWIALSFLRFLQARITWDEGLAWQLKRIRVLFVPIVNPVGMSRFSRCNGNGVDLMRNAPITAENASFLVGGHFISPHLPWYRGNLAQTFEGMETESKALIQYIQRQTQQSIRTVILDMHSGFGLQDQLWFPFAKSTRPFPHLPEVHSLKLALDKVHPNHIYRFEPQAKHYTTHGDLWDYLYLEWMKSQSGELANQNQTSQQSTPSDFSKRLFLPLTLELGSWRWVKKNPIQLFSFMGHYNPVKPHRQKRALRRHLPLFDFLTRIMTSPSLWWPMDPLVRNEMDRVAKKLWF